MTDRHDHLIVNGDRAVLMTDVRALPTPDELSQQIEEESERIVHLQTQILKLESEAAVVKREWLRALNKRELLLRRQRCQAREKDMNGD